MTPINKDILQKFATKFAAKIDNLFARKTDIPTSLPAKGGDAATVNGHTVQTNVPSGAVFTDTKTWGGITGKPSTFPPSAHTHGNADITDLDAAKLTGTINTARLPAISATSVPWTGITNKPSTFPPSAHTHTFSQISDLEECTDADIDAIIAGTFV
nr:hypothetical protein [uncultured Faecalicatena sp.]